GGKGALRIDTGRGDKLPLEAQNIVDLIGATVSVANSEGKVVLSGKIQDFGVGEGKGGGLQLPEDGGDELAEEELILDGASFEVAGIHDASFRRGDANMDGVLNLTDPVIILGILFQGTPMPYCQDAADGNDDGKIDISDAIAVLQSLFEGALSLPEPGADGEAGFDPTSDQLFCEE